MADDPPRKPTRPLPDHERRDQHPRKTPPKGVLAQIAPQHYESWEDKASYTPVEPTPPPMPAVGRTPATAVSRTISDNDLQNLQNIDRRVRETKNTSITTLDRVEVLRKETRDDIKDVNEKVDAVIMVVGELREDMGEQKGSTARILDHLEEAKQHRERTEHVKTTTRIFEAEVDKTRQLTDLEIAKAKQLAETDVKKLRATTEISDESAAKAVRREIVKAYALKALVGIGVLWAAISAYLLAK